MSRQPLFHSLSLLALFILLLSMICGCATGRAGGKNSQASTELDAANRRIDDIYHRLSVLQFMVDSHDRILSDRDEKLKKSGFVPPTEAPAMEKPVGKPVVEETIAQPDAVTSEETATVTAQGVTPLDEAPAEAVTETAKKETLATATANVEGKSIEAIYAGGLDALKAGDYPTAAAMFRAVVEGHPNHDLADNAVYWTGEIFYDQKDYKEAIRIFKRLVEIYPTQGKVPDALLKIGYSYHSLGDRENAVSYLKKVVVEHPFTDPGSKAEAMLNKIEKTR